MLLFLAIICYTRGRTRQNKRVHARANGTRVRSVCVLLSFVLCCFCVLHTSCKQLAAQQYKACVPGQSTSEVGGTNTEITVYLPRGVHPSHFASPHEYDMDYYSIYTVDRWVMLILQARLCWVGVSILPKKNGQRAVHAEAAGKRHTPTLHTCVRANDE